MDAQEVHEQNEIHWLREEKYVLIFSQAGKPIFATHPDPLKLSSLFGLLQAMLSKTNNRLHVIQAGGHKIVFSVLGPLIIVMSSRNGIPTSYIQLQAEYLYAQILFHFTLSALQEAYRRNQAYDLRVMLGNTGNELEGILEVASSSPCLLLNAVPVLRLPGEVRLACTNVLSGVKQSNLLYAVLLCQRKLVTHISPKRHPLQPSDLLLLLNFVNNAKQLQTQETWTPLCLPGFNSTGFLHAYAAYLYGDVCLLLLSSGESLDQFHYCSEAKSSILTQLYQEGLIERVQQFSEDAVLSTGDCDAASAIHVLYKSSKCGQYVESDIASHAPLHTMEHLLSRYVNVHSRLVGSNSTTRIVNDETVDSSTDTSEHGEIWDIRGSEAVLASYTQNSFQIFAAFHVYVSASQAAASVTRFALWVNKNKNDVFMAKPAFW